MPVDTPFAVGTVNTYLLEGDPLTLVDCGPNTGTALDELEAQLRDTGHRLEEIEVIFVTHQHLDHGGLAGTVAARSGAELVCLDRLAPILADWEGRSAAADDAAHTLMLRHGIDPTVAAALRAVATLTRGFGAPAQPERTVAPGDSLQLGGRRWEVLYRPGHSLTDTVLLDTANGVALLGDHLLAHVSSNALLSGLVDPDTGRRPEPLLQYRHSLEATRELEFAVGLTGHGEPVREYRALIDGRLAAQTRRAENFLTLLADGPRSAHELATARWGAVAITQAFLTLSEVLGHLGLLLADGRVVEDDAADVVRFTRAPG
ncbi:MAG TPA: MBL fold metallo-hydrolase [Solirubrobacteraceae bacterium]|nr:MBL fold metallo-hydrolase [Solirubrobacteraceae bacterium]